MNSTLTIDESMTRTSIVVTPFVATPWTTPVFPPLGTVLRDRSALTSMHSTHDSRQSYVAGGSMKTAADSAINGSAGNGTGAAAAKQDRPPRGEPR